VRFVADFIGDTNFLDGEIGDDGQSVILPGGHGVALSVAAEPGRRVTAAVRPERVAIAGAAPDGLQATVETVVYFGTDTIHHLRLEQSLPFVVRVQNHDGFGKGFSPGDRVSLVIPPDAVRLLED